ISVSADCDAHTLLERMNGLAADMPTLSPSVDSMSPSADGTSASDSRIHISVMGKMELDVIRDLYRKRYGGDITFGSGTVRYMETIEGSTVGYGHYEPLRHYAEVIVRIEAAPRGSGVSVTSECPEDVLSTARQKTIVSALMTETHYGVLTGSPLTDVHIVLTGGRIHVKHTEGGDLRQAARRAVRQGLMKAKSVLLEPCYEYTMELPSSAVGRAMTDLDMIGAAAEPSVTGDGAVITGRAAAAAINSYQSELASYTGGEGRLLLTFSGYIPVKDTEEIVSSIGYDPSADTADPPDSVFCIKGAAAVIRWDEVENYIHSDIGDEDDGGDDDQITPARIARFKARLYSDDELMEVFERTYGKIDRPKRNAMRRDDVPVKNRRSAPPKTGPDYLLVDGYNIIFAWDELSDLARTSLDHARKRLIDILANYTGFKGCETILVFDAYKVRGGKGETERESGITVVYTKEAETADMYIERASYEIKDARRIRVATSDYAEQLIILGNGALRVPAAELHEEIAQVEEAIRAVIAEK
ncbi:MAG: NYN domain-containing protein, partial [Oscillospiraceae bacterium]|nr:NYN domain-containing protein [Oscillospiraceae bacterium]